MIFKKLKNKHYFKVFPSKKHFEKQPLSYSQTPPKSIGGLKYKDLIYLISPSSLMK
jgi:hypothetical protein